MAASRKLKQEHTFVIRSTAGVHASAGPARGVATVPDLLRRSLVSRGLSCILIALLTPSLAAAQSSRDDGIRAVIAGDYARAAQLLGPLAEEPTAPDGVAVFLMAMLYESGRGVGREFFRACALYLKAAATPGPFADQAAYLGHLMRDESGPRAMEFCNPEARWRPAPMARFDLGPDHSVEFSANQIVVRYRGQESRTMMGMLPDMIPLPIRYSPLDVAHPERTRRHFVEWFSWWRDTPSSWALGWTLSEVVGTAYVPITGDRALLTSNTAEPPAVDPGKLAGVRVAASGEAEWVVWSGPNPRSTVIPWRGPK